MATATAPKRPAATRPADAPRADDDPQVRQLGERATTLRGKLAELKAELVSAEAATGTAANALARGEVLTTRPVEVIRQEIRDHEEAVKLVVDQQERARLAASNVEARRIAGRRAAVAVRALDAMDTLRQALREITAIDNEFVSRGYRRSTLPACQLRDSDRLQVLDPVSSALQTIRKAGAS